MRIAKSADESDRVGDSRPSRAATGRNGSGLEAEPILPKEDDKKPMVV
jgi:hypothetical protein